MASGHVKWFNDAKGFGFIIPDDQTGDVFVHFSSIVGQSGRRTLQEGDKVDYVAVEGPRGLHAEDRGPLLQGDGGQRPREVARACARAHCCAGPGGGQAVGTTRGRPS